MLNSLPEEKLNEKMKNNRGKDLIKSEIGSFRPLRKFENEIN